MHTTLKALGRRLFGVPRHALPVVCLFGCEPMELTTPTAEPSEEERLDCRCYATDADLARVLVEDRPDVLISCGSRSDYPRLAAAPAEIRRRWQHYDVLPDPGRLGALAFESYLAALLEPSGDAEAPLVTVFTPAYRTGDRIERPFRSLQEQTYTNWEWIVVDDSDDAGQTFARLAGLARLDHRVRVFKAGEHSGVIGRVKRWACSLGSGQVLVELDHDDALTDSALAMVVEGFREYPEAGFLYTDCAEVREDGSNLTYRDGWAFGYGTYSDVRYRGRLYKSGSGGNINAKTIRHIVSAPNHLRAWRTACYHAVGGHNRGLAVADDYELLVRTFLATRMVRVPWLGYIQHAGRTAQHARNADIHRHVRAIRAHYDRRIHERLLALGCEDAAWDAERGCSDHRRPNPPVESRASLLATR
jgi:hypothetical protein